MADKSLDIVSKVDLQELDNAINQAMKEIQNRYDLKDSDPKCEYFDKEEEVRIESDDTYKVSAIHEILTGKLIKRGISPKSLKAEKLEENLGGRCKQIFKLQQGLSKENTKVIVKHIKDSKLKLSAQIQGEQVRVTGKKIDDLQSMMQLLKSQNLDVPLSFVNMK